MHHALKHLLIIVLGGAACVVQAGTAVSPHPPTANGAGSAAGAPTFVADGSLTLQGANSVLAGAIAAARVRAAGGAIAVVDSGGHLIALQRLDGTFAAGAEVSIGKARTAALFKKPTRAFEEAINGGRTALAAVQQLTPLTGGVPIIVAGRVVGGVGVSGAHSQDEDEELALAGASAVSGEAPEDASHHPQNRQGAPE